MMNLRGFLTIALLATGVAAHPGHDINEEMAVRREHLENSPTNLDHCIDMHRASGLADRAIQRRGESAYRHYMNAGLHKRQVSSTSKSHKSDKHYNITTPHATVFGGNKSCVVTPEGTEGPFYVIGETIRSNITEDQAGIPLYLDFQVIDVTTCKPIPNIYFDVWNANSTGVYSGSLSPVNGVYGMSDKANLNKQFLRGLQLTDEDGAVSFTTSFPGHYATRATHIHIATHLNAKPQANNTVWDLTVTHAGQLFFDQDLLNAVEKLSPYTGNTAAVTPNNRDQILLAEAAHSDPFFDYVMLGNSVADGVFVWYTVGVNPGLSRTIQASAENDAGGGKMRSNPGGFGIFPGGLPTNTALTPVKSATKHETAVPTHI
jgi:protocatechuate 3,4-dioxygenase beta subunit